MMLPIGLSILTLVFGDDDEDVEELTGAGAPNLATGLMLGIAYSASIGSLATLIGTPPNVFMASFLEESHDVSIGFGQWMLVGLPLAAVFGVIAWLLLTRVLFPSDIDEVRGGREIIQQELDDMGPMGRGERIVGAVFVVTALLWVFRSFYAPRLAHLAPSLEGIDDAGIAIAAAIALFLVPVSLKDGIFALDWETAKELPWGVLLLFGGGICLARAFVASGLSAQVGDGLTSVAALPIYVMMLLLALAVTFLTEATSNTATTALLLPVLAAVALAVELDPLWLMGPAAMSASCAFMLPVATAPNAVVFGSGELPIQRMVREGFVLNLIGAVVIATVAWGMLA